MRARKDKTDMDVPVKNTENGGKHCFVLENFDKAELTSALVFRYCAEPVDFDAKGFLALSPSALQVNDALFVYPSDGGGISVTIELNENILALTCNCGQRYTGLCRYQARAFYNLINRAEIRSFFDRKLRHEKLKRFAEDYGLQNEEDPDAFFGLEYSHGQLLIKPKVPGLFPVTNDSLCSLEEKLLPAAKKKPPDKDRPDSGNTVTCIVLRQHKYYKHLLTELYTAGVSREGKIKNPMVRVDLQELIRNAADPDLFRFYTAISRFQGNTEFGQSTLERDIEDLKAIVKNPPGFSFFYHNNLASDNVNSASVIPAGLKILENTMSVQVAKKQDFYEVSGHLTVAGTQYPLHDLKLEFGYFVRIGGYLYLPVKANLLAVADFFKKRSGALLVHYSKYDEFRKRILARLENDIAVTYLYLKEATPAQIKENGYSEPPEKMLYITASGAYIELNPVMKYGMAEIPVLTRRLIYSSDNKGNAFLVKRDKQAEDEFIALLVKQHSHFSEQLEEALPYFYIHKDRFLQEEWFLKAFEEWESEGISVLGFNEIEGNRVNPQRAEISVRVTSGTNWFNTDINVRYGRKRAPLKQIYRAVRNKSKFIKLDDGTLGVLPAEWMEKFAGFFQAGEMAGESLHTAKINYPVIPKLYSEEQLDEEVKDELQVYRSVLANFGSIKEVEPPVGLNGILRSYQRQGLNWLNFLDDLNFGGCLADDMGLGKSVQIIAFILSQRLKVRQNTNLLVVPTSLIFNWQEEFQKFAPSVSVYTVYGADRVRNTSRFDHYEVILTSYGTLLSDISFLRKYEFNYIFLDESQNIKNPGSQRYKAVRLLQSRNKIAISGTPMENNTFDLYGQLSFACPGLLGSRQYFRDIYSVPIDKFKDRKRSLELQKKISPFILRRTKQQVATELPDKTEITIYCEMLPSQRQIYEAYEKEFREFISATTNEEIPKKSIYVLKGLTTLRQICNSPVLLKDQSLYAESSAKIQSLIEQIESRSPQHKILVFSQFVSMLELIKKELIARNIRYSYLTGATKDRNIQVRNFQEDPEIRIFLISLKAGGTGLNLTAADYVYIVDPWWNPSAENQAIDRCFRIGQKKNVMAVRLICPDTIEEKIVRLQETKKDLAEGLIKSETSILKSLTKSDLMNLL